MFNFTKRTKKNKFKTIAIMSSLVLSLVANAQTKEQANDAALLDSFIQSRGYSNTIIFSSINIKQFWIDHSVVSQDNTIKISMNNSKSIPYKIQLANVSELQDCKVDIISNRPDLMFSVLDNNLKVISDSKNENSFIHYNIASASFHLEDTNTFSFYLQLSSSSKANDIAINRIILSFSDNKESHFLHSPGKLIITESNCYRKNGTLFEPKQKKDAENSFFVKGKYIDLFSNNKIYVSDNTLSNSVTIKNIGDTPIVVRVGYAPYTKEGKLIDRRNSLYKGNKILRVVSSEKGRNTIIVDSEPEWTKGCYLALNAKEDLSDFPNYSWVDGTIQDVKKIDNEHFEILFDKPNQIEIKAGTTVRVQSPAGAMYIFTHTQTLLPGEEANLSSEITKDDTYFEVGPKKLCRGTYYVVPILLSRVSDSSKENNIQISSFSVSY